MRRPGEKLRRALALLAFLIATAALYAVSRGKWSDPIIDSGREWIVPDTLARGGLLYRDVVYWFGPFTPYFQAAFFRAFGSSLGTLVLSGAVASAAVLAALHAALRLVTDRREALLWTALAVPALVFMPNAGGSLLGMGYRIWHAAAFTLAAIVVSSRAKPPRAVLALLGAGALAGLAGLCRTEWGLVAAGAAGLCRIARAGRVRDAVAESAPIAAGFAAVFAGGLAPFLARAGGAAVLRDGHVLLTGLPEETRTFLVAFSGVHDWKRGIVQMAYSFAMWFGAWLVVDLAARPRPARAAAKSLLPVVAILAAAAALGGASGAVLFSAAPLVCAVALATALSRRRSPRAAATAAFAAAGLLLSYRRPFHIGDSAYVGPPLLFAFVSAAALLSHAVSSARPRPVRVRLRGAIGAAVAILVASSFAGRFSQYVSDDRVAIPGTEGMLSARDGVARDLALLTRGIRAESRPEDGLVAFPEGEIANLLSGRRNPIRHKLYLPGYLTAANEPEVLAELQRARPRIVLLWNRTTSEYGPAAFGGDYAKSIGRWIAENYDARPLGRDLDRQVRMRVLRK